MIGDWIVAECNVLTKVVLSLSRYAAQVDERRSESWAAQLYESNPACRVDRCDHVICPVTG